MSLQRCRLHLVRPRRTAHHRVLLAPLHRRRRILHLLHLVPPRRTVRHRVLHAPLHRRVRRLFRRPHHLQAPLRVPR